MSDETAATAPAKSKSKMAIMREILQENPDMQPTDIQKHLQEKYGVKMSTAMISNYKSGINNKKPGKRAAKKADAAQLSSPDPAPVKRKTAKTATLDSGMQVDDIGAVAALKNKFGRDVFLRLVSIFC